MWRSTIRRNSQLCCTASRKEEPQVEILSAGNKGDGVFAAERIRSGQWICSYQGTLVRAAADKEAAPPFDPLGLLTSSDGALDSSLVDETIPELDKTSSYLLEVERNLFIDAQHSTHFSRYCASATIVEPLHQSSCLVQPSCPSVASVPALPETCRRPASLRHRALGGPAPSPTGTGAARS